MMKYFVLLSLLIFSLLAFSQSKDVDPLKLAKSMGFVIPKDRVVLPRTCSREQINNLKKIVNLKSISEVQNSKGKIPFDSNKLNRVMENFIGAKWTKGFTSFYNEGKGVDDKHGKTIYKINHLMKLYVKNLNSYTNKVDKCEYSPPKVKMNDFIKRLEAVIPKSDVISDFKQNKEIMASLSYYVAKNARKCSQVELADYYYYDSIFKEYLRGYVKELYEYSSLEIKNEKASNFSLLMYCLTDHINAYRLSGSNDPTYEFFILNNKMFDKYPQLAELARLLNGNNEAIFELIEYYEKQ